MPKALGLLLALIAGALLLTLLWVSPWRARGPVEPAAALPEAAPPPPEQPPVVSMVVPASEPAPRVQTATLEEVIEQARWEPSNLATVLCEVRMPPGVPADERLELLAYDRDPDRSRREAPESNGAEGEEDDTYDGAEFGRPRLPPAPIARALADREGRARLEVPRDLDRVWIALEGRYLLDRSPRTVVPADPEARARFEPILGAWLLGRLEPASSARVGREDLGRTRVRADLGLAASIERAGAGSSTRDAELAEDLSFSFGAIEAGASYDVRVVSARYATAVATTSKLRPGERSEVRVPLRRGAGVGGVVVDDAGEPVSGARVRVRSGPTMFGQGGHLVRTARSVEGGAFFLDAVTPGEVRVEARLAGFLEATESRALADGETVTGLRLVLGRGGEIAGRVLWPDGSPAEGARVEVEFDRAHLQGMGALNALRGGRGTGRADGEGRFRVTGLGKGPFSVRATRERADPSDPASSLEWVARADGRRPGEALELVLQAPAVLRGTVLAAQGRPVERFQVSIRPRTDNPAMTLMVERRTHAFTDPTGAFAIPGLDPGAYEAAASAEGYGPGAAVPVDLPQPADGPPLVLTLPEIAMVRGRVLDPLGRPVAGAEVREQRPILRAQPLAGTSGDARSDEGGAFELSGLEPGARSLVAGARGFADSEPVAVELVEGAVVEDVVLRLRSGGRILGRILEQGEPLPGATLLAQPVADPLRQRTATSDPRGQFLFEHAEPGSWQVMHLPTGGGAGTGETPEDQVASFVSGLKLAFVDVRDGEDTEVTLGEVPLGSVELSGRVRLDGRPQGNVFLNFIADGPGALQGLRSTASTADGRFEVKLPRPGSYVVHVQRLGATPGTQESFEHPIVVPEVPEHTLDIDLPVGAIAGRVRGPDGRPAGGVRISLAVDGAFRNNSMTGGQYAEVRTDEEGRYELVWLRPGTYTVAAGGSFMGGILGEGSAAGRAVRSGLRVEAGQRLTNVDFELAAPGTVAVRVRDASGAPVSGAAIFARDGEGRLLERISMLETDGAGKLAYGNLAPGEYTFTATAGPRVTRTEGRARVRAGETSEVELVLDSGTILRITLADGEGEPIDCHVLVLDEQGRQVNGALSLASLMEAISSGTFSSREHRVGPLPPGRYTVSATAADGSSATRLVDLKGQPERTVNLRLRE